jgi:hypothetical protein
MASAPWDGEGVVVAVEGDVEPAEAALEALRSEVAAIKDLREQVEALDGELRDFTTRLRVLEVLVERQRRQREGPDAAR